MQKKKSAPIIIEPFAPSNDYLKTRNMQAKEVGIVTNKILDGGGGGAFEHEQARDENVTTRMCLVARRKSSDK